MTTAVLDARINSQPIIIVQFFDSETGTAIDLTGSTSMSATLSGSADIAATSCSLYDAAAGKVQCAFNFSAGGIDEGVYRLTVFLSDSGGRGQRYPLRSGQMLVNLTAAT